MEKLTILMPLYNKAPYIAAAIDSILMQKVNFDLKIIIIDDKSTDDGLEVAARYQKNNPNKIHLLANEVNQGCFATTLKGYELLKSEYFCVLDPDDFWINEHKLQRAINFLDNNKDYTIFFTDSFIEENNKRRRYLDIKENKDFNFDDLEEVILGDSTATIFRNVIFKNKVPKELYDYIGTSNEKCFEGDSFRNILHLKEGKAHYEDIVDSVYRITNNSLWSSYSDFKKNNLNAKAFLNFFLYFGKIKPEFFLKKCLLFCNENLNKLKNDNLVVINRDDKTDLLKIFEECLKYKKLYPPLVSVPIITYNQEKFIEAAVTSVLSQNYENIEIIISDDKSTDNTVDIVMRLTDQYPDKIKLIVASKNQGASANMFRSISECRGEYILPLAGDDELLNDAVSEMVDIMEKDNKIAICYSDAEVFDVQKKKRLYLLSDKFPTKSGDTILALKDAIYYSPATMFRSQFKPIENSFSMVKHGSDLAFYKEIMLISAPHCTFIKYIPKMLYRYQKHGNNITMTENNYRREHIKCINILKRKYPNYKNVLNAPIYDFCCVGFIRSFFSCRLIDMWYFLSQGIVAARGNPFKFFRAITWAIRFFIKSKL